MFLLEAAVQLKLLKSLLQAIGTRARSAGLEDGHWPRARRHQVSEK